MKSKPDSNSEQIEITDELVEEALALAAQDAIEVHRRAGVPLVVWRDGKIAYISADEAALELAADESRKPRTTKRKGKR